VAIIAILAGLILATAGYATSHARRVRTETERDAIISAISSYKDKKGQYPPDNPNSTRINGLFYELTGVVYNPGGGPSFVSKVTQETLLATAVKNQPKALFGRDGFVNSSPDINEVDNFYPSVAKSARTAQFAIPGGAAGATFPLFGVAVVGPLLTNVAIPAEIADANILKNGVDGKVMNIWQYVSTNPTNNPNSYDLWMEVPYAGKTNRISNWSKDPQPHQ
jgi:hypothetical protein